MHIIDVNTCSGRLTSVHHDLSLGSLVQSLDSHQVACAVTCCLRGVHYDPKAGNTETLAAAAERPFLIPAATLDLRDSLGWEKEAERCLKSGVRIFRFFPEIQGWSVSSLLYDKMVARLQGTGVCLMLSAGGWGTGGNIEQAARLTAEAGLPLILTDTNYNTMSEVIAVMQEFPHVYAETNWLASVGAIEVMAEHVGADRLLYGSAAPMHPMQKALNQVLESDLPPKDKEAILGGNATRLLGIPESILSARPALTDLEPKGFGDPIVDVHSHLGYWRYPIPDENYDPTGMIRRMKRFGITHSIVSSYEGMRYDIEEGNRRLAAAIAGHPGLLGYVELNPHFFECSCAEMDKYYGLPNFVGAEIELSHTVCPTGSREVRALMAEVARRGKPVLFMPSGSGDAAIERELARQHSGMAIIHAHGMDRTWARTIADTPNISVEFCRSKACHHDIRDCLEILGPKRILFGSDQTLLSVGAAVGLYLDAEFTASEQRMVLSENAERIFRLP